MCGKLELIIGPMFSGKSTELIRHANRYISIGKKVLAINHSFNKRYGSDKITTHDNKIFNDCVIVDNLDDLIQKVYHKFKENYKNL